MSKAQLSIKKEFFIKCENLRGEGGVMMDDTIVENADAFDVVDVRF